MQSAARGSAPGVHDAAFGSIDAPPGGFNGNGGVGVGNGNGGVGIAGAGLGGALAGAGIGGAAANASDRSIGGAGIGGADYSASKGGAGIAGAGGLDAPTFGGSSDRNIVLPSDNLPDPMADADPLGGPSPLGVPAAVMAGAAGLAAGAGIGAVAASGDKTGSSATNPASATGGTSGTAGTGAASDVVFAPHPGVSLASSRAVDDSTSTLPATPAAPGASATVSTPLLTKALDAAARSPRPFLERYELYDSKHREFTDTAVVQRARGKTDGLEYAIKFFTSRAAYERERSMYADRDLRAALPPVTEIRSNEDGEVVAEDGWVFQIGRAHV